MAISDVSNIASASTSLSDARTSQAISVAVLKRAIDVSAESATALIAAIPEAPSVPNLPSNLGRNVNTTA
jgi:hypothetical protein